MDSNNNLVDAIVFDLDGTLLNDKKIITDFTYSMIQKCKSKDIKLSLATARGIEATKQYKNELGIELVLYNNGAIIEDHGSIIDRIFIDQNDCRTIMQLLYTNKSFIGSITLENYEKRITIPRNKIDYETLLSYSLIPTYKITAEIFSNELVYYMKSMLRNSCLTHFSNTYQYRFSNRKVSKSLVIPHLFNNYGISRKKIMAFGDDVNDLDLLKKVRYGIAMGNATDELKKVSFDVCLSNNVNGVANYLSVFLDLSGDI